jgi:hypothetical protein
MFKKRVLILAIVALMTLGAANAGAQVRLDVQVPWLIAVGATLDAFGSPQMESVNVSQLTIPLPMLELAYQFGGESLSFGVGIRTLTLLVEFFGWPMVYAEFALKPIVLRAELGGFAFFAFGVYNDFLINQNTMQILIPDISAEFAFTDWFRAGAGVLMLAPAGNLNNFGWAFYVNARFSFLFKDT